ncbi:MAG: hypothetical protein R2873_18060 [Caldilineaceae bacterium]
MRGDLPGSDASPSTWILAFRYIACYLIWFLICGVALWLLFLFRTNLVEDILFLRVNPWQLRTLDKWFIYVAGAVWIVAVFLLEGYLRKGVEQGKLLIRAGRILAIQLALVALSYLIQAI